MSIVVVMVGVFLVIGTVMVNMIAVMEVMSPQAVQHRKSLVAPSTLHVAMVRPVKILYD